MKRIDLRSAAIGALLALVAVMAVTQALAQRAVQPMQVPPGNAGRYQLANGPSISRQNALYAYDQQTGDLFCFDAPQASGYGPDWNVRYAGNVIQMVNRVRR